MSALSSMNVTSACPECAAPLAGIERTCGRCGTEVGRCPQCGTVGVGTDRFCGSCGHEIPAEGTANTPEPTADRTYRSPWDDVIERLAAATDGEYEIIRELGRGGMAAVFLAHEIALNRKVAIKVMSPGIMADDGMIERFRQEAVTVANLSHANIVSIHAVREVDDLHFFVMKFIDGKALDGVLATENKLSLPIARALLAQVGSALSYAHRRGVIHRDVKPANILLGADGDAFVTDFGIAKVVESPSRTQTGAVPGTAAYMSPEQCYAMPLTPATDQYSLGVVAYEMLAGRKPFLGSSSFALMHAHITEPVAPIRSFQPECPADVDDAVLRMLAKKAEDRWPSIVDALAALHAFPVMPGNPVLEEIGKLANASASVPFGELFRTPPSPAPASRSTRRRPSPASSQLNKSVAGVAASGLVTALAAGDAIIAADCDGHRGTASIAVALPQAAAVAAPIVVEANARPRWVPFAVGAGLIAAAAITGVVVSNQQPNVPAINSSSGRVDSIVLARIDSAPAPAAPSMPNAPTTVVSQTSTIGSSAGRMDAKPRSATASATATVAPRIIAQLTVTGPTRLEVGDTASVSAIARDAQGDEMPNVAPTWSSDTRAVVEVDASGRVIAHAPGTSAIRASVGGIANSATITVVAKPAPVVATTKDPAPPTALTADAVAAAESKIREVVGGYANDLRARSVARIESTYDPETALDRANLGKLLDLMRTKNLEVVSQAVGPAQLDGKRVAVDLSTRLRWRGFAGARQGPKDATFRVVLEPADGSWRIVSARIFGDPHLQ